MVAGEKFVPKTPKNKVGRFLKSLNMRNLILIVITLSWGKIIAQMDCSTPDPAIPEIVSCNPSGCTNEIPTKYLGLHMVFLLSTDGKFNFNERNDGLGNSANNGYQRAEYFIDNMNWMLENNQPYSLDPSLAVCSTKIRVFLKSVKFIRTANYDMDWQDSGYNQVMSSFAINSSNDFTLIHHYNSKHVKNGLRVLGGYGPGPWITTWNDWNNVYPNDLNYNCRNACHELFHALSLSHAWPGDQCSETKNNTNVWCNGSNNVMDYNCYHLFNLTPCQICRMHDWLNNHTSFIDKQGDCFPPVAYFDIPEKVCKGFGQPEIYMQASASSHENMYLLEIMKVSSIGSNDPIQGTPVFSSWYNGQAYNIPLKQKTGYNFSNIGVYRIKLGVDHTDCTGFCDLIKWVTVQNCFYDGGPATACCVTDMAFAPNPTNTDSYLFFTVIEAATININLTGISNPNSSLIVQNDILMSEGNYMILVETNNLSDGIYSVQLQINNGAILNTNIVVQH